LTVEANNAWSFELNSADKNPLRWLESTAQGLLSASSASEWAMTPSSQSEALSPTNFNAQQTSFFGAARIPPVKIGNAVLYVQQALRKLREMTYFFYAGTFRSADLSELSEHITLPQILELALQKETQPIIWSRRSDGALLSLLYNRDDVSLSAGWASHFLGGYSDNVQTPAQVKSMGVIPDPAVTFDQLWVVVKRYINGATVYTVEYFTKINDPTIAQEDSFHLDCGATYTGAPTRTVSGLTWLKNETVSVLVDGKIHPDCVVSNTGTITLDYDGSKVQVGYGFLSKGKTLRDPGGSAIGTSIGQTRRTHRVALQLYRTGLLEVGEDFNSLRPVPLSLVEENLAGVAPPLFSGIVREGLESSYDFEGQVCFQMSSPLPGTIQSITTFFEEFDV
jgi:hypothetical protein